MIKVKDLDIGVDFLVAKVVGVVFIIVKVLVIGLFLVVFISFEVVVVDLPDVD